MVGGPRFVCHPYMITSPCLQVGAVHAKMHSLSVLACVACFRFAAAVSPLVTLNYTSYEGTALSNGVTQWLGVRYAAPPLGDLRFQAPQDPVVVSGIQAADHHGPICLGTAAGPPTSTMQEDCLFLDIYAPSNTAYSGPLPVYFFIQASRLVVVLSVGYMLT